MKKLKLSIQGLNNGDALTRDQLKRVLGGDGSGSGTGTCQNYGDACDTQKALNCCNTLVCGNFLCKHATD